MLALAALPFSAQAHDRHVCIQNDTGMTLSDFDSPNAGASRWGSDVMAASRMASALSMRLNFDNVDGCCAFDFRAVFGDGTVLHEANANICKTDDYYCAE